MTPEQEELFDELTQLQQRVAINVLAGMSQRQAYYEAGGTATNDNSADATVSELLSNLKVKAFMDAMKEEAISKAVMSRQEAMERLSALARTSLSDLVEFGTYELGEDENGNPIKQTSWHIRDSVLQDPMKLASIHELSAGRDGLKIKQHSVLQAIKQLQEMQGWNSATKVDLSNTDGSLKPEVIDASQLSSQTLRELLEAKAKQQPE